MEQPRVLVGSPVADVKRYCLGNYIEGLRKLTYKNFDVVLVDNSKTDDYAKEIAKLGFNVIKTPCREHVGDSVIEGMNILRDLAIKEYDYFLCLHQDVVPPTNVIEKLLEAKKDIVTGVVPHVLVKEDGIAKNIALIGQEDENNPEKYRYFNIESVLKNKEGIIKVDFCATNCLMLSKDVLKKIKFRVEIEDRKSHNPSRTVWDNVCFCRDAKKKGLEIWANLAVRCQHLFYGGYCVTLGDTRGKFVKDENK